jgi:hypothetical protein
LRANRNGIKHELLNSKAGNPFSNKKRQSLDVTSMGSKKNMKSHKSLKTRHNSVLNSPDKKNV